MFSRILAAILLCHLFQADAMSQATATASISATIISYVAAESGDDLVYSGSLVPQKPLADFDKPIYLTDKEDANTQVISTSFKVFGANQVYDVSVENKPVIINDDEGKEALRIDRFKWTYFWKSMTSNEQKFSLAASIKHTRALPSVLSDANQVFNVVVNFN
jgi:hypothetical protein